METGGGGGKVGAFRSGIAYVSGGAIWVADARDFEGSAAQLSAGPGDGQPALSRDGTRVAYVHTEPDGSASILELPTTGGTATVRVSPTMSGFNGLAWSPDGATLYYAVDRALWKLGADNTPAQLVTGELVTPSVASDGTLFALDVTGGAVVRVAGGAPTTAFSVPGAVRAQVSPSGTALAYEDGTAHEIFVFDAPTAAPRQLTRIIGAQQSEPCWSTDGTQLFFTSNAGGADHIYRVDASAQASSGTLVQAGSGASAGG
jgi:Tol biopolymer transport system component